MSPFTRDLLGGISDLIGFIGAILVAVPFVLRERTRDQAERIQQVLDEPAAPVDALASMPEEPYRALLAELRREIREHARSDYRYGVLGAGLLALGFLIRLVAFALALAEY
jgi:hypothetical protein